MWHFLNSLSNEVYNRLAIYSTLMVGVVEEFPVSTKVEELAKLPITMALIALAGFAIWMSFRNYEKMMAAGGLHTINWLYLGSLTSDVCIRVGKSIFIY